jgi:Mg2+ and Co2+ transporter CorA
VRKRIHQLKDFIRVTPEWINYALIDNITDSFAPLIQHTELEVDSIDDLVLVLNGSEQNDMLRRIGSCRKSVMQLLRLLGPKADVVRSLIKRYEDKAKETN